MEGSDFGRCWTGTRSTWNATTEILYRGGAVVNSRHVLTAAHIGINKETSEDFEAEAVFVLVIIIRLFMGE